MLEHTFLSQLQESRCRCSFKQFPKRECPGSCSTEGTLVNAYSTFPNIHADIQVLAEVSFERQGLCLDCCYGVFAFQVWQDSQHLAMLCFALWVLITCCNWSWGGLNENLPLKYVVVFVVLLFLTSFLKVIGLVVLREYHCFALFKALVGSVCCRSFVQAGGWMSAQISHFVTYESLVFANKL